MLPQQGEDEGFHGKNCKQRRKNSSVNYPCQNLSRQLSKASEFLKFYLILKQVQHNQVFKCNLMAILKHHI